MGGWNKWRFLRDSEFIYLRSFINFLLSFLRSFLLWILWRLYDGFLLIKIMFLLLILCLKFLSRIEWKPIIFLIFIKVGWMLWKLTFRINLLYFLLLFFNIWWKVMYVFTRPIIYWRSKIWLGNHYSRTVIKLKHIWKLFLIINWHIISSFHPWISILAIKLLWTLKWIPYSW